MSGSPPSRNQGIVITGGNVQAGAMAAGPHAHAEVFVLPQPGDLDDVQSQLSEIRQLLTDRRDALDEPDEVISSLRAAEQELAQERPDKPKILALLKRVTAGVGSVEGLATALGRLFTAVNSLL